MDTKFNLASVAKLFTATAVMQLVEAGRFSVDDPLIKVLPDYPNKDVASKFTIHQLVAHRSGLGDFVSRELIESPGRFQTIQDYLPLSANDGAASPVYERPRMQIAGGERPRATSLPADALKQLEVRHGTAPPSGPEGGGGRFFFRGGAGDVTADRNGLWVTLGTGEKHNFMPSSALEFFDRDSLGPGRLTFTLN